MLRARSLGCFSALLCGLTLLAGGTSSAAGAAGADQERAALSIERVGKGVVASGQKLRFTGTAPRILVGRPVTLQRRVGDGRWVNASTRTVDDERAYTGRGVATGGGLNSWRFVARDRRGRSYTSPELRTRVHTWYYLTDSESVDDDGAYVDAASIGGRTYGKSILTYHSRSGSEDWIEYNLDYRCVRLQSDVGVADDSESGATGLFTVFLDGAQVSTTGKGLGPASRVSVNTKGRLRVRLTTQQTGDPDATLAFGNPRALCSRRP